MVGEKDEAEEANEEKLLIDGPATSWFTEHSSTIRSSVLFICSDKLLDLVATPMELSCDC